MIRGVRKGEDDQGKTFETTELKAEFRHDYRAHRSTKDGDELIRFYMPPAGMRYRHFVHELAAPIYKGSKASGPIMPMRSA